MSRLKNTRLYTYTIIFLGISFIGLSYFLTYTNQEEQRFLKHSEKIQSLGTLNSKIDGFLLRRFEYFLFEEINQDMNSFLEKSKDLIKDGKNNNMPSNYIKSLEQIKEKFLKKELLVERIKSKKAFESELFSFIFDTKNSQFQRLSKKEQEDINLIRVQLIQYGLYNLEQMNSYIEKIEKKVKKSKYSDYFFKRAKLFGIILLKEKKAIDKVGKIQLDSFIDRSIVILHKNIENGRNTNLIIKAILFFIIFLLIVFIVQLYGSLKRNKDELFAFQQAVNDSYNSVIITDVDRNIVFVNNQFEKNSGYSLKEVFGRNPRFLSSETQDESFYKEMNTVISSGKTWYGQFINRDKNGELFYENTTISPIIVDDEITGYLAIKLDVTKDVTYEEELLKVNNSLEEKVEEKTEKLNALNKDLEKRIEEEVKRNRENEIHILEQSKMASIGEVMTNIAHHWRQPLNVLVLQKDLLVDYYQCNELTDVFIESYSNVIDEKIGYLSETIDMFSEFTTSKKIKRKTNLSKVVETTLHVVSSTMESEEIDIIDNTSHELIEVDLIEGELPQVLINILNNSKEILLERKIPAPWIKIDIEKKEDLVILTIEDNGQGIEQKVFSKIFEPYITTKFKSQGTGLGLHLSYNIVVKNLGGKLYGKNTKEGAKFFIELPLN
ncbi:MAG: PAS domain-containing sensor histidine kinase [Campylobacterales bacterium]|nr:PAS domain-containing sensor histidine kinase [Campylobacterales bacterium]